MRRVLTGMLVIATIALLVITAYTTVLTQNVYSSDPVTSTSSFQYIDDSPLSGEITLSAVPEIIESEPTYVFYNITLDIIDSRPMNLTIEDIEVYFTPTDYLDRAEVDIPKLVGSSPIDIFIQNATRLNIQGRIEITPVVIEGNVYLGGGVEYSIRNHSSTEPNAWSGTDGNLLMIPITVYPVALKPDLWRLGFGVSLTLCIIVILYRYRE